MKTAIYIEDGLEQLVLTPETPMDKLVLERMHGGSLRDMTIHLGSFYECGRGHVRYDPNERNDNSTIIVFRDKPEQEP